MFIYDNSLPLHCNLTRRANHFRVGGGSTLEIMRMFEGCQLHFSLPYIMYVATKVHVKLRRSTILEWMHDNRELV